MCSQRDTGHSPRSYRTPPGTAIGDVIDRVSCRTFGRVSENGETVRLLERQPLFGDVTDFTESQLHTVTIHFPFGHFSNCHVSCLIRSITTKPFFFSQTTHQ